MKFCNVYMVQISNKTDFNVHRFWTVDWYASCLL